MKVEEDLPPTTASKSDEQIRNNQRILGVTMVTFALFVIAEVIGALAANSLSLMGDAAAMSIDVITYAVNMRAEYIKGKCGGVLPRRTRWILEVIIPACSIAALMGVTVWICEAAIVIIQEHDNDGDVDVILLYGYAAANMLIDLLSAAMFYARRHEVFTNIEFQTIKSDDRTNDDKLPVESDNDEEAAAATASTALSPGAVNSNLNMISAFTHVGSDTLRTLSIFAAAMLVSIFGFNSSICDAWAAIVVSVTIFTLVIPLSFEIYKKAKSLTADDDAESEGTEGAEGAMTRA